VERNALTAGLTQRAQDWRWGSLWAREQGSEALKEIPSPWPVARPANWSRRVNQPIEEKELTWLQNCVDRGQPCGNEPWTQKMISRLHLEHAIRREGRPKREKKK
jgi:hypothetical protein